ncbi:MAG: response regulator [Spirochaetota bacterium]
MKALIAEDDSTSRLLLKALLKPWCLADAVENGAKAVEAAREALKAGLPYDLVILDCLMPEMDGPTALRGIRQLETEAGLAPGKTARIILATAHDEQGALAEGLGELCDAIVAKPLDRTKIGAVFGTLGLGA